MAPRPITAQLLSDLFTGHKTNFRNAFAGVTPDWSKIATEINSSAGTEKYDWLGQWPRIRKWVGDRVIKQLSAHGYSVENEDWESTIAVKRKHIEDDQLGIYGPMFQDLGRTTAAFPDELVFPLLANGHQATCYDGQNFFDTDHPVTVNGEDTSVSNTIAGAATPWFLLDTSRGLKPLIYQNRRAFDLVALDKPTDPNVFMRAEYIYGVDGRAAAGYGFWQMAVRSQAALDAAGYKAARAKLASFRDDEGKPLGTKGTLLVVPSSLEGDGREVLFNERNAAGATNVWRGTADLLVSAWLD